MGMDDRARVGVDLAIIELQRRLLDALHEAQDVALCISTCHMGGASEHIAECGSALGRADQALGRVLELILVAADKGGK